MRFSLVTVTCDNASGLHKTAASLAAQNYHDYEWIVIDGASTDGSVDFLKTTTASFFSEPDDGIYDAMNKGIDRARGDYILFLNAGDSLAEPDTLTLVADRLAQTGADLIYGDALEERAGQAPAYKKARPHDRIARGLFTHHQAIFYRREALRGLRYDTRYQIAADYKFTAQFLARGATALYIPSPLCLFESGGISQRRVAQGRNEQFLIRRECGIAPLPRNLVTYIMQLAATLLRRLSPSLYWRLRQSA